MRLAFRAVALLVLLPGYCLGLALPKTANADPHILTSVRVPILMYHYVRINPNPRDRLGADLSVTPLNFAAQMNWLWENGFHTISMDDLNAALRYGAPLPSRSVVLTFDDGYEDVFSQVFPVLQGLGFEGTSFVITGRVGRAGYLTWDQMREMQASGVIDFESHTVHHVMLSLVPSATARLELLNSKADIEEHLGKPVHYFCYPSGRHNAAVDELVANAGYLAAVSTRKGMLHTPADLAALARVRIHGRDSLAVFAGYLRTALINSP